MVLEHGYWNVNGTAYSPVMLAMVGRGLTSLDVARCCRCPSSGVTLAQSGRQVTTALPNSQWSCKRAHVMVR